MNKTFPVLDENIAIYIGDAIKNWDGGDQDWFYIHNGWWFIKKGTIWDGATIVSDGPEDPKKPGYPITWLATLIHDLGYMFMLEDDFPYTRKQLDKIFYDFMEKVNFKYSKLYYKGVRIFGGVWNAIIECYRKTFNMKRQMPSHLSEYERTEISVYT